jgi:hypothetical protein
MATTKVLKIKLDAETKQAVKALKTTQKQVAKNTAGFKKLGGTIAKFVGAAVILKGLKDITKAAIKQENAIKALNVALKNTGESFTQSQSGIDAMSKNLQQVAADIQKVTTVGDEVSLEVMQMGLAMGITADKIGEATKESIGLSKAFKIDLRSSIKMVALARAGDFNMLQRYIPQLKLAKTTAEKQKIAFEAMADGYKIAQAEAETFGGKITQLGNTFGDFKERLGAGITQNENFSGSLDDIKKILEDPAITDGLSAIIGMVAELAAMVTKALSVFPKFISSVIELKKANEELTRVQTTQAESFDKALKKAEQFMDLIDDPTDLKAFWQELEKITSSSDDFSTKATKMNDLFRSMRDGKYGEGLAKDFEKFRKEQTAAAIEAAKLKKETEALTIVTDKNSASTSNNTKTKKEQKTALEQVTESVRKNVSALLLSEKAHKDITSEVRKAIPEVETLKDIFNDVTKATEDFGDEAGELFFKLGDIFGALTRLGGPLGDIAGGFANVAGDVGNLINGLQNGIGLDDIPNVVNLGISAFQAMGSALGSVGKAIGGFFKMWGKSEWEQLMTSTRAQTDEVFRLINTFGMTPGVVDRIKQHLATLPAGFEATRRALEQLLIDAGQADAAMRGIAGRPALEPGAGPFKPGTDTPTFGGNKNTGSGFNPESDFMSAANGFNGILKKDTIIQAHKGEPVSITPKGQAMKGGGDKIDNRRQVFNFNNELNVTETAFLQLWKRAFRHDREGIKRVTKEELGLT